jgi:hypothetical protein
MGQPVVTAYFDQPFYNAYMISIYDAGMYISNRNIWEFTTEDGKSVSRYCNNSEIEAINAGTATVVVDGWEVKTTKGTDGWILDIDSFTAELRNLSKRPRKKLTTKASEEE